MTMAAYQVHDIIGLPDYLNCYRGRPSEVAWLIDPVWHNGRYLHDHSIAMERSNDYYHRLYANGMTTIVIEQTDGNQLPWGWRFRPVVSNSFKGYEC
jgi:hypothetical protein